MSEEEQNELFKKAFANTLRKLAKEYIENNTYKIEWGDLEQDNEDININEDLTEKEFIEEFLEILDKENK